MADVVASAVRLPTPEPATGKRKRNHDSPSPPPRRRRHSPPRRRRSFDRPLPLRDGPDEGRLDGPSSSRPQHEEKRGPTEEDNAQIAKTESNELISKRSGGVYIPPAKLRELQKSIKDPKSKEYQRMMWEALKKSINGMINKVNIGNIRELVPELFHENLVRGQGLFCRSIMKAQALYDDISDVLACVVAIVNSKFPQIGELLVNRLIWQWQRAFKRNDKAVCISSSSFLAQLTNFEVVDRMVIVQVLLTLLKDPSDDGMEIAIRVYQKIGRLLDENDPQIATALMNDFRKVLQGNSDLLVRTQYSLEALFMKRRSGFKEYPIRRDELDIIQDEDVVTHNPGSISQKIDPKKSLDVFQYDEHWEETEAAYLKLRNEILGLEEGSDEEEAGSEEEDEDEEDEEEKKIEIKDKTNQDLVNLRRSIYLTIKSSGTFEEAVHKLMRINLPQGKEKELPEMIIECASQERTYNSFYGNIGERFSKLNRLWRTLNEELFMDYYKNIHLKETNQIRTIANYFAHLLVTDAISWSVFECIHMNEDETTAASRIFVRILLEEIKTAMGQKEMADRFQEPELAPYLEGLFPAAQTGDPKKTRFSINYFTAIKMGILTEGMREFLNNIPKPEPEQIEEDSYSDADSDRSTSTRSDSYDSYDSRSPPRRRIRGRSASYDRSRSRSPERSHSRDRRYDSESPPPRRVNGDRRRRSPSSNRDRSRSADPRDRRARRDSSSPPHNRRGRYSSSPEPRRDRSPPRRRRYSPSPRHDRRYDSESERGDSRSPPRRSYRARSESEDDRRGGRGRYGKSDDESKTPPRREAGAGRGRRNSSSVDSGRD